MSEVDEIVGQVVPVIATAVSAYGAGVLTRVQDAAADATMTVGERLLKWLLRHARQRAPLEGAVTDLAADGQDPDAMVVLRHQIRKILNQSPELAAELARLMPRQASAFGPGGVAVVGDNSGPITTNSNYTTGDNSPIVVLTMEQIREIPTAHQLESAPADFVGRDDELELLTDLLRRTSAGTSTSAAVALISGMPGVGKTGLALQWAHGVKKNFPDGQLFVDLRGYAGEQDGTAAAPAVVLGDWLKNVWGVKPDAIPDGEDARAALFRSKLDGKRMLLVLDNAATDNQVRPLLPATGLCFVIVTGRDRLSGLISRGGKHMHIKPLSLEHARTLLETMIGERAVDYPEAIDALARHCGYLTLALRVVAGRALGDDTVPLAELADQLGKERLDLMGSSGDEKTYVRAVLSWSYRGLPDEQIRQVFRLLGLHPPSGATTDAYAVARLADTDTKTATKLLDALHTRNLVNKDHLRFGMHDLLRDYAKGLVDQPAYKSDRRDALERLADAYYGCVNHAFDRQNKDNLMVDADFLAAWRMRDLPGVTAVDGAGGSGQWFARERENLIAVVRAAEQTKLEITPRLACSLFYFLETGRYFADWEEVEGIARRTAFERHDVARSLRNRGRLAMVHVLDEGERLRDESDLRAWPVGACRTAIELLDESLRLYREEYEDTGLRRDRAGEATTLRELADARRLEIDPAEPDAGMIGAAILAYRDAELVYQDLDNENGLASLQLALGRAYLLNRQFAEAEACFDASLNYASEPNDNGQERHPRLKGYALRRLGDLCYAQGERRIAVKKYDECIAVFGNSVSNDPTSKGRALAVRGRTLAELGDIAAARASLTEAREIFARRALGDDDPEAQVVTIWLSRLPEPNAE